MESSVVGNAVVLTVDGSLAGESVADILIGHLRLPHLFVRELLREGRVSLQQQRATGHESVQRGHRLRLVGGVEEPDPQFEWQPGQHVSPLDVLYEDDHILVVNKPVGVLIYPGTPADEDTLGHRVAAYYLEQGVTRRVRHVHRLDKETTGAVLYAKHAYSARTFDAMVATHEINRLYLAVVAGRLQPPVGKIDEPIGRDRHVAGRYRVSPTGKEARTVYRTLATARQMGWTASLAACVLETGRTHQIRVHMASKGAPIVGDALYGSGHGLASTAWPMGLGLHATSLHFFHPYLGEETRVAAPVPEAFHAGIEALGFTKNWAVEADKAILHAQNIRG